MRRSVARVLPSGAAQFGTTSRRVASSGLRADTLQQFSKPLQSTARGFTSSSFISTPRRTSTLLPTPQGFGNLRKPGYQVRGVATRTWFQPTWVGTGVVIAVGIGAGIGMTVYASEGPQQQSATPPQQTSQPGSQPKAKEEPGFWEKIKQKNDRFWANLMNSRDDRVLLPPALPPPHGKEYTVVIAAEVLCCQKYEPMAGGLLVIKRPGVEYFLAELAQNFEIVIWSMESLGAWNHLIEKLDPNHHIQHRLFIDSTILRGPRQVKSGFMLNRPLSRIIIVDTAEGNAEPPENVIYVQPYFGLAKDVTLMDLIPFFKVVALTKQPDVRGLLASFKRNGPQFFKAKYEAAMKRREDRRAQQKAEAAAKLEEEQRNALPPKGTFW